MYALRQVHNSMTWIMDTEYDPAHCSGQSLIHCGEKLSNIEFYWTFHDLESCKIKDFRFDQGLGPKKFEIWG